MSTAHRVAVVAVLAFLAWVVVLMATAPVQDIQRVTVPTVAPAVTFQGDVNG